MDVTNPKRTTATGEDVVDPGVRERLLDAGERLFATRGFQIGVRDLTCEAECNVAAVNYYFGGKEALYREVFRRRISALRERRIASVERTLAEAGETATLELLLRTFVTAFLEPLVEESTGRMWIELVSRELLDPHLPGETFQLEMIDPVRDALVDGLRQVCPGLSHDAAAFGAQALLGQLAHVVHLHGYADRAGGPPPRFGAGLELTDLLAYIVRFNAAGIRAFDDRSEEGTA